MSNRQCLYPVIGMLAIAATGILSAPIRAQSKPAAAARPSFEVASVKQNKSGQPFVRFGMQPGGRFTIENGPLKEIIRFAYGLQNFQIVGGPDWMTSDRFDVVAKAEGDVPPSPPGGPPGPMMLMTQTLLEDRFALKAHNETRELPIYAIVLARSDGKLGPKIRPAATDCAALFASMRGRGGGPPAGGPPPPPPGPGRPMTCGMRMMPGNVAAGSSLIAQLAVGLSNMLGRVVVDKTGLSQNYDYELTWTPDQMPPQGQRPPGAPELPPIDPNGPSIFTAVQEQLGLKLESQKGPVEVFVIDSVEHPTDD